MICGVQEQLGERGPGEVAVPGPGDRGGGPEGPPRRRRHQPPVDHEGLHAGGHIITISPSLFSSVSFSLQNISKVFHGWKENKILKIEKYMHAVPITFGMVTAIAALVLEQYNPANWDCWIAPLPEDCTSSHTGEQYVLIFA